MIKIDCIVCKIDDINNCDCSYVISGDLEKVYWDYVKVMNREGELIEKYREEIKNESI